MSKTSDKQGSVQSGTMPRKDNGCTYTSKNIRKYMLDVGATSSRQIMLALKWAKFLCFYLRTAAVCAPFWQSSDSSHEGNGRTVSSASTNMQNLDGLLLLDALVFTRHQVPRTLTNV